jgi:hypothetical protein
MAGKKIEFKVTLEQAGNSQATGMIAPKRVVEFFATRGRVPVRGTINGYAFRSSLMPMSGCHMMAVNKIMREGAGVKAGDTVDVAMERDLEERTVDAPPLLKKALEKHKKTQANWDKLAYTHKKEMAKWITEAKQEETRVRRVAKVIDVLKTGTKWPG